MADNNENTFIDNSDNLFFEDIEGPIGLAKCSIDSDCTQIDLCNIKSPINKINNNIRDLLSKTTLNEITT